MFPALKNVPRMKAAIKIGRPPLIRQTNAEILLRLLRESGPCSKADLVRASGLSAPSVTNVVASLISIGLVETVGEGDSTGGRPPGILRFKAEHGCVAAVEITRNVIRFLLADLNGREMIQSDTPIEKSRSTPRHICRRIAKEICQLLRKRGLSRQKLFSLTVGVPAIVNVDDGTVLAFTPLEDWNRVSLGPMLARELKCPVLIDNDTNLAAQGEFHFGAARGESDFVFIYVGEGVGAGVFLNGHIYRGSQWSAGEIGYLPVPDVSREHPAIHRYGKLEQALSASGILEAWRTRGHASRLRSRVLRATDVWDLAAAGNVRAKRILKQRATMLADVILDLALILNPNLILLGGDVGNHPALLREVNGLLEGSEFAVSRVELGTLGSPAVLLGAVLSSLEPTVLRLLQAPQRK